MKYRRLGREELEALSEPFVRFLAAQGIAAADWTKMKVVDEPRTETLVEQFSDMVFDDVLRRAAYLEERDRDRLLVYKCSGERLELRGLIVEGAAAFDFRQNLPAQEMLVLAKASGARVRLAKAERNFKPDRHSDLFLMLERGAKISPSSELFDLFDQLVSANDVSNR